MTAHTRRKVLRGGRGALRHRHGSAAGRGGARCAAQLPLPDA
ncbi:hypothetical protein ACFY9S_35530 [Streptomyces sp. NPDC012474]